MNDEEVLKEHEIGKRINERYGHMTNCTKCRGKGFIHKVDAKGYHFSIDCECKPIVEDKHGKR